ncbi:MAG: PAS domain S-box protein, partial [Terriglobales bacterium]
LYDEAEQQAARAEHSKKISDAVNSIERDIFDILSQGQAPEINETDVFAEGKLNGVCDELQHQLATLAELTRGNPEQMQVVADCQANFRQALGILGNAKSLFLKGLFKPKSEERQNTFREMRRCIKGTMSHSLLNMARDQRDIMRQAPELEAQARAQAKIVLVAFACVTIAFTVAGFVLYTRAVTRRLNIMLDNNLRLAMGRKLNARMSGNDEIADLDAAFHSMADSLADAAEKERSLMENALDVIYSLDEHGTFIKVNAASTTVFGYTPDELLGSKFVNLVAKDTVGEFRNALKIIVEGANEPPFEMRIKRQDGRIIYVSWSAHWSKQQRTISCVAHDITERKQAERMRQEVMQMVSHDLKTPLSTV